MRQNSSAPHVWTGHAHELATARTNSAWPPGSMTRLLAPSGHPVIRSSRKEAVNVRSQGKRLFPVELKSLAYLLLPLPDIGAEGAQLQVRPPVIEDRAQLAVDFSRVAMTAFLNPHERSHKSQAIHRPSSVDAQPDGSGISSPADRTCQQAQLVVREPPDGRRPTVPGALRADR